MCNRVVVDALISSLRAVQFPSKHFLLSRLVPVSGRRSARVFGYEVELDLHELIQRNIYLGCYERHETKAALRYLRPGMTTVDVGANVGYFTLLFARKVGPTGQVFSYEPSPIPAGRLQRTIARNAITQVRLEQAAMGAEEGTVPLHLPPEDVFNYSPTLVYPLGEEVIQVPIRTLDEELRRRKIDRIDLLKADVEGYEPQVLRGASQAISEGRITALLIEFNDEWLRRGGSSSAELWETTQALGYRDPRDRRPPRQAVETRLLTFRGATSS